MKSVTFKRANYSLDDATIASLNRLKLITGANKSELIRRGIAAYYRELCTMFPGLPAAGPSPTFPLPAPKERA